MAYNEGEGGRESVILDMDTVYMRLCHANRLS